MVPTVNSLSYFFNISQKGFVAGREQLGEGYDGDIAFASSLEMFGGGHNDPISVAFGGQSFVKIIWYS